LKSKRHYARRADQSYTLFYIFDFRRTPSEVSCGVSKTNFESRKSNGRPTDPGFGKFHAAGKLVDSQKMTIYVLRLRFAFCCNHIPSYALPIDPRRVEGQDRRTCAGIISICFYLLCLHGHVKGVKAGKGVPACTLYDESMLVCNVRFTACNLEEAPGLKSDARIERQYSHFLAKLRHCDGGATGVQTSGIIRGSLAGPNWQENGSMQSPKT
ncbi:hypothetical protein KCU85_g137, partial [Aureobasidium melanogenum]